LRNRIASRFSVFDPVPILLELLVYVAVASLNDCADATRRESTRRRAKCIKDGLDDFVAIVEAAVGRKALRRDVPMQPGDVPVTWASTALLEHLTGFKPAVPLSEGMRAFVARYRCYYDV